MPSFALATPEVFYNDYQAFTAKTALYPTQIEREYLALGLCSEAGEIAALDTQELNNEADIAKIVNEMLKELGDCTWYAARLCSAHRWAFADLCLVAERGATAVREMGEDINFTELALQLCASSGTAAGVIKKQLRDGHTWSGEKRQEQADKLKMALIDHLQVIVQFADGLALVRDEPTTLSTILQMNQDKLEGRLERGTIRGDGDSR